MALSRPPEPIGPVRLHGRTVRLEPMAAAHIPALSAAGADPELWRWYLAPLDTPGAMQDWCGEALRQAAAGTAVPFTVFDAAGETVLGSTRLAAIDREHRRAEIGWTWLVPAAQRTAANTESKFLLLRQAFESWGLIRVEFKTDSLNARSRAALRRIGATEEGTFRNHMITHDGRIRHSVYFSITDAEWPAVKEHLQDLLGAAPYRALAPRQGADAGVGR